MPVLRFSGHVDVLALHALAPEVFPYILTSSGPQGWDMALALEPLQPALSLRATDSDLDLRTQSALADLDEPALAPAPELAHLPFRGGWFVYLGYEVLHSFEPTVPVHAGARLPVLHLARCRAAIQVDRLRGEVWLFCEDDASFSLTQLQTWAEQARQLALTPLPSLKHLQEDAPGQFLEGVARIRDWIHAGDVFQVNLSRAWQAEYAQAPVPVQLLARLRAVNPSPFAGLACLGEGAVVSSSPERLLRVQGRRIETRPIAGTHPRAANPLDDQMLRHRLIASSKERAEHVMLVDLERNDLGRVAVPGSVTVEQLMAVTTYAFVHHIESSVAATLAEPIRPSAILRALFPGGTITGCPKVRTMQIIHELETAPREAYTGSMGYLNRDGSMDLNILIRTLMVQDHEVWWRAGAGIVADSDPERELQETGAKARGLMRALELL